MINTSLGLLIASLAFTIASVKTANAVADSANDQTVNGRLMTSGLAAIAAGKNLNDIWLATQTLKLENENTKLLQRRDGLTDRMLHSFVERHAEVLYRGSGIFPTNLDLNTLKAGDKLMLNLSPLSDQQVLNIETERLKVFHSQLEYMSSLGQLKAAYIDDLHIKISERINILESAHTSKVAMNTLRKSSVLYQNTLQFDINVNEEVSRILLKKNLEALGLTGRSVKNAQIIRAHDVVKFEELARPFSTGIQKTPRSATLRSLRNGVLGVLFFGGLAVEEYLFGAVAKTLGLEVEAQENSAWRPKEALPPSQR